MDYARDRKRQNWINDNFEDFFLDREREGIFKVFTPCLEMSRIFDFENFHFFFFEIYLTFFLISRANSWLPCSNLRSVSTLCCSPIRSWDWFRRSSSCRRTGPAWRTSRPSNIIRIGWSKHSNSRWAISGEFPRKNGKIPGKTGFLYFLSNRQSELQFVIVLIDNRIGSSENPFFGGKTDFFGYLGTFFSKISAHKDDAIGLERLEYFSWIFRLINHGKRRFSNRIRWFLWL